VTRTLVVLRHAKSAWPDDVADRRRPLADRGRRDASAAGRWLRDNVGAVDLVLCSPALRTRQTWELVSAELVGTPEFRLDERIYAASLGDLLEVVTEASADTVLLIGHNPGLSELVGELARTDVELKTSSVAVLRQDHGWSLVELATPRG
jgi:phosphohistidine phosphatase